MKIFYIDYDWAGMTLVVASNKEEAISYFKETINWTENDISNIIERSIENGLVIENLGDR